ncbi:MAG TPA: HEAT repeat domain-containing protein, partial [Methanomicrobiales archaeon]|nr:HEAT repeat domain-containing protein [Methanomicrobiales archaeon]
MSGDGGDLAGWIATLKKGDLAARHEAEDALGKMGEGAVEPLIQAIREETDTDFRWYAARVLARIGPPAIGHLTQALKGEKDQQVQRYLAASLGEMGEAAVRPLLALLSDPVPGIRGFAAL